MCDVPWLPAPLSKICYSVWQEYKEARAIQKPACDSVSRQELTGHLPGNPKPDQQSQTDQSNYNPNLDILLFSILVIFIKQHGSSADK